MFDVLNRLTSAEAIDHSVKDAFSYDAQGRRISKTVYTGYSDGTYANSVTTNFAYDGTELIAALDSSGNVIQRYQWGQGKAGSIGALLSITDLSDPSDPQVYTPVYDSSGNIVSLLDSTGTVVASYTYSAFGKLTASTGPAAAVCPFGYQTMYRDAETGLSVFPNRYYSPTLGRWMTRDPSGESSDVNLTRYCDDDPINGHDPTGLDSAGATTQPSIQVVNRDGEAPVTKTFNVATKDQVLEFRPRLPSAWITDTVGLSDSIGWTLMSTNGYVPNQADQLRQLGFTGPLDAAHLKTIPVNYPQLPGLVYITNGQTSTFMVPLTIGRVGGGSLVVTNAYFNNSKAAAEFVNNQELEFFLDSFVASTIVSSVPAVTSSAANNMRGPITVRQGYTAPAPAESEGPAANTPTGRSGSPLNSAVKNEPTVIGDRAFSGHSIDGMQADGITPSVVENTIENGTSMIGKVPGTTAYYDSVNNVTVIINSVTKRVVTVSRGLIKQ